MPGCWVAETFAAGEREGALEEMVAQAAAWGAGVHGM